MDILIIDDEKIIRDSVSQLLEDAGHYVECAVDGTIALKLLSEVKYQLVLLDINLGQENGLDVLVEIQKKHPAVSVVVSTAAATIHTAVEAMRLGALDFLEKPFNRQQLALVLSRIQKHQNLMDRVTELQQQVATQSPQAVFTSSSQDVHELYDILFRAATTTASILILGESGTGKTVAARAVHQASPRANKSFITVNSPGLSKQLIEGELFGHLKGAFTGAIKDHWGKVKAAEGGTLFFDEIGEMPLELQAKLLRLIQDREYERVGETVTHKADVRIIAATNRDLQRDVEQGLFREDLYYRLNVITVEMPPLRHRVEDLLQFAENYMKFFAKQFSRPIRGFTGDAKKHILKYTWPGNLRELRNAIERAVILCRDNEIGANDLSLGSNSTKNNQTDESSMPRVGDSITLEELETAHITALMGKMSNLSDVSRVLGIDQATLYRKRKKLDLGK